LCQALSADPGKHTATAVVRVIETGVEVSRSIAFDA
jgi:hypothetical protein